FQLVLRYRALVAGNPQAPEQFVTSEGFTLTVLLHHGRQRVFHALVGREAPLARIAFAPAPGHRAPGFKTLVDHATIGAFAIWALHGPKVMTGLVLGQPSNLEEDRVALFPPKTNELV